MTPNGLIAHMFGPLEGRRHDAFMLSVSGLTEKLRRLNRPNGEPYVIYGDPAYGVTRNILAPYRGIHLTSQEKEFNRAMSSVRVSVEWTFGKVVQYFAYLDFKKKSEDTLAACRQILSGWSTTDQLPYLSIWLSHYQFFWRTASLFGNIFI